VADHATNVAEMVIFMVKGRISATLWRELQYACDLQSAGKAPGDCLV